MAILPNTSTNNRNNGNYTNDMNGSSYHQKPRPRMSDYSDSSNSSSPNSMDDSSSSHSSSSSSSYHIRPQPQNFAHSYRKPVMPARGLYLAMDCEMVGTTTKDGAYSSVLARVVLIDWKGRTVLDSYVKPCQPVTDYRTFVSGITPEHLVDAPSFDSIRAQVQELVKGKILVGHGLENDLGALQMQHPWWLTRDTAYYQPFMRDNHLGMHVPRKLKDLCASKLSREIQLPGRAHCPAEDAQAALDLYKSHRPRWEACLATHITKMNLWATQQQQQHHHHLQQLQQQHSYYAPTY